MTATAAPLQAKDYASDQEVRWCPGCGDYAILKAVQKTLADIGARRENTVFVSGIGCAARFPYYVSTYGAIHQAVREARDDGLEVSHLHLRYLNPFPSNLGDLLKRFDHVLVPEMNNGQLVQLLRAAYLVPAVGLNKVEGKPFKVAEIVQAIESTLRSGQ